MLPLSKSFIALFFVFRTVACARIFGFSIVPSISHQKVYQPLFKQLSLQGHQVTVVTPNPLGDVSLVNLTEIDVSYIYEYKSFITDMNTDYVTLITALNKRLEDITEVILQDEKLKLIYQNQTEEFDAVIIENHSPLLFAFGTAFRAPIIGIASTDALLGIHGLLGNPIHAALFGDMFLSSFLHLTIWQKIQNMYYILWDKWHYNFKVFPRCDKIAKRYFGDRISSLDEASKNVSLMFLNTNHYIHQFRPLAANSIPIGFVHINSVKPLPSDLQQIMDQSTNGVVYMSLGSNVKSSTLPPDLLTIIVNVLSNLPYTVLWKWEADNIPGLSKNIVTRKWFPQQDVLAHPNVKVFLTQGGLQSIEEAISQGVPMVGMPFVADQPFNMDRLAELRIAERIDWKTVTEEKLNEAIIAVAEKKEYRENIKQIRDVLMDQPMTGLEKAVWWTEYVIRHKGAKHLRSILADTPLWEYLMLDVIAVLLVFLIASFYVIYKLTSYSINRIKAMPKSKIKSS